MKLPLLLILSFIVSLQSFAQNDTSYIYLDSSEHICDKDTSKFVKLFYKQADLWYSEKYSTNTRFILEETTFSEDSGNIKQIIEHKEFSDNGILYKRLIFVRGVMKSGFYYYPNGAISGTADFSSTGEIIKQSGFDENGGVTRQYYFAKEPELIGDAGTWRMHIYRKLRTKLFHQNKAPLGDYKLELSFYVDVDGTINDIEVDKNPGFGIKEEAIRLVRTAGKWNAGYINGQKSKLLKRLTLSFRLDEETARKTNF
jgi:hypothetical protein